MYLIKEAAAISGVSVRTLHHYDRIGLLVPHKGENGYRYYTEEDLEALQSILFYKYLGFSLNDTRDLLERAKTDRIGMLEQQLSLLEGEQRRLASLIRTLEKTIRYHRGETTMTTEEKFSGLSWKDGLEYTEEARRRYGDEAIDGALSRQKEKEPEVEAAFNQVFFALADNLEKGLPADAPENLALAETLLGHIRSYAFDCTIEVFGHIGAGYYANPEFRKNIDRFKEGTARYASDAVKAFVERSRG